MLQLTPHMKIYAARDPITFRSRFDGTAAVCRNIHQIDPYSGSLFAFMNKPRTMIRCYLFNGHGEWLCDYRISQGKFRHWVKNGQSLCVIDPYTLYILLRGGDPSKVEFPSEWKKIN